MWLPYVIPAIKSVLTAITVVFTAIVTAATIESVVESEKRKDTKKSNKNDKIHTVYTLVDTSVQPPKVEYVGRTIDVKTRKKAHQMNNYKKNLTFVQRYSNLDYNAARGIEQQLIIKYSTLNKGNYKNNQINGISWKNPNLDKYMRAADSILGGETYVGG